tara:strand:- start:706 stop:1878 length:1173 start_codon:yes stop_codon:yes gene_type:complete
MFSFLKKKDDKYKNQKITYPLLGLILGSTVGYYVPFVFLFTKFLSISAVGGAGTYAGNKITREDIKDNYYMYSIFEKYDVSQSLKTMEDSDILTDHLFRKHIISHEDFDINYSYRVILRNLTNKKHILSICYNDIFNFAITSSVPCKQSIQSLLNYTFYHICQYYIYIKDIEITKEHIELINIATFGGVNINNDLLVAFDYNDELFIKIYISIEKIIMDDIIIKSDYINYLHNKHSIIDNKIFKYDNNIIKNETPIKIYYTEIHKLWVLMFNSISPYEKLSIFYKINKVIIENINNITNKSVGADDTMPILIDSLLTTKYEYIYSSFVLLEETYNNDIYDSVFEFLYIKYKSVIQYILKIVKKQDELDKIKVYVDNLIEDSVKKYLIQNI